jgi:hypothetical protein
VEGLQTRSRGGRLSSRRHAQHQELTHHVSGRNFTERLVRGREGWQQALTMSRNEFSVNQMRALIRRFPTEAAVAVREFGAE